MNKVPFFSIVTVSFNSVSTIGNALSSLASQTCKDFEWVVIDGGSTDGTYEWLQENHCGNGALISEPDNGIYDAMNKGIAKSKGEWLFFLNTDDEFAGVAVLQKIKDAIRCNAELPEIVFGNAIYTDGTKQWLRSFDWVSDRNLVFGDLCHQVVFAKREVFKEIGSFDSNLRYNADFDWLLRAQSTKKRFLYVKLEVSKFYSVGAHARNAQFCNKERAEVRLRYVKPVSWKIGNFLLRVRFKLRRFFGIAT